MVLELQPQGSARWRLEVESLGGEMEAQRTNHATPTGRMGRRTRVPFWARVAVLLGLGLAMAFVENWMLWGFFVSRPHLVREIQNGDALVGFSMLKFRPEPTALALPERALAAADAASFCRAPLNECREGRLVLRVDEIFGGAGETANVGAPLLHGAWADLAAKGWLPTVHDPRYRATGRPVAGLVVLLRKPNSEERLVLAYRTSEIANDLYAYSEALFRVTSSGPLLVKQVHFFLDIAGMEGLEWPLLWPVNVVLLLPFWALVSINRLRKRLSSILRRSASSQRTPSEGAACSD